jgi:hypothetical protein
MKLVNALGVVHNVDEDKGKELLATGAYKKAPAKRSSTTTKSEK